VELNDCSHQEAHPSLDMLQSVLVGLCVVRGMPEGLSELLAVPLEVFLGDRGDL